MQRVQVPGSPQPAPGGSELKGIHKPQRFGWDLCLGWEGQRFSRHRLKMAAGNSFETQGMGTKGPSPRGGCPRQSPALGHAASAHGRCAGGHGARGQPCTEVAPAPFDGQGLSSAARWRRWAATQEAAHPLSGVRSSKLVQSSQKTALSSASWTWGWNKSSHRLLHLPATKLSQGSGLLCLRAPMCSPPGTAGFPQGPEQDPRSPVELPSCGGSFWSRIHPRPHSEPLAAGFSFAHGAVAQCREAVGIPG